MKLNMLSTLTLTTVPLLSLCAPVFAAETSAYKYGVPEQSDAAPHCVIESGLKAGSNNVREFEEATKRCYQTLAESVADATEGNVSLPLDTTGEELGAYAALYSSYTVAEFFDYPSYGGPSILIKDQAYCFDDVQFIWDSMPVGWNDRVGSARGSKRNNCELKLWEHINWDGESSHWFKARKNLHSLQNQASSFMVEGRGHCEFPDCK